MNFEKSVITVMMFLLCRICAAANKDRYNVKNAYCQKNVTFMSSEPLLAAKLGTPAHANSGIRYLESWKLVEVCCEGFYRTATNSCEPVCDNREACIYGGTTEQVLIELKDANSDYWHIFGLYAVGVILLVIAFALLYCSFCSKGGIFSIPRPPPDYNPEDERRRLFQELRADSLCT